MTTTNPPVYACTDAKGRCIDTAWAQWSYKTAIPDPRFATITDTTGQGQDIVKDLWTGLYWQLVPSGSNLKWMPGQTYCAGLSYGGFSGDWRLPSPIELSTLVDYVVTTPPTAQSPFVANTISGYYWTSAPSLTSGGSSWLVNFGQGSVLSANATLNPYAVRCVR